MDIKQFDPTASELQKIVEITKLITASDLEDPKQLSVVKENRISLKNARVRIEKTGKALRDDAIQFQRAVIAKEKELVAIIEPEEERLKAIELQAKAIEERKKRVATLPSRRAILDEVVIHDGTEISDDQILDMDEMAFSGYVSSRQAVIMEKQRAEIEQKDQAEREALHQAARAKEMMVAQERARQEERDRLELETKRAEDKRVANEILAKQKAEAEERALQTETRYQAFLIENGYTDETSANYHIVKTGSAITLYKKVATYNQ